MLQHIPTHVIAGPLGAGKTSLILHLLGQRPANERWAVLVNEFGQIGLDAALLTNQDQAITITEVAGGCLCCVNGAPFQVALGRLLRSARPHRLFIEPSGLGHPLQLLAQLHGHAWRGVLDIQPLTMVLDATGLAASRTFPQAQRQALAAAGLLVINKASLVDEAHRLLITHDLPELPRLWTDQGRVELGQLPTTSSGISNSLYVDKQAPELAAAPLPTLWQSPLEPIRVSRADEQGWSIGWRWHPARRFSTSRLEDFLGSFGWLRAKMVIHSTEGWCSFNAVAHQAAGWRNSEWRKDSRIELIFEYPQLQAELDEALRKCLVDN
ncbi:GTP-binding protein [Pseudomonas fulva]|nr:CobW-like GTP-binding protein [Pseudomonas fulva]MBF8778617.1 GTP-binding protein [Pseudomonas fulva]